MYGDNLNKEVVEFVEKYDKYVREYKGEHENFRDFLIRDKKLFFILNEDFSGFLFNALFEEKKEHLFIKHILPISKNSRTIADFISSKLHWLYMKTKDVIEEELPDDKFIVENYNRRCALLNALIKENVFDYAYGKRFEQSTTLFSMIPLSVLDNNEEYFKNVIKKDPLKFSYDFFSHRWILGKNQERVKLVKRFFLNIGEELFQSLVPDMQRSAKNLLQKENDFLYTVMRKEKNKHDLIFLMSFFESNIDLTEILINQFNYIPCEREKELIHYFSKKEDIPLTIEDPNKQKYIELNNEQKLKKYILKKEEKNVALLLSRLSTFEKQTLWESIRNKENKNFQPGFTKDYKVYHEQLSTMAIMSCSLPVLSELMRYKFPFTPQHYKMIPFALKNTNLYDKIIWEDFRKELKKHINISDNSFVNDYIKTPFIITENRKEIKRQESFINDIVFCHYFISPEYLQSLDLNNLSLTEISNFLKFYLVSHSDKSCSKTEHNIKNEINFKCAIESLFNFDNSKPSAKKRTYEKEIMNKYQESFNNKLFSEKDFENMSVLFKDVREKANKQKLILTLKITDYLTIKMEQRILNESGIIYNKENKIIRRI